MEGAQTLAEPDVVSIIGIRSALASGRVAELRKRVRLSQGEFARAIGVSPAAVSRWESGARLPRGESLEQLVRVVRLLEQAVDS